MWKFNQREKKCIQQTRIVHSSNQFSGKLANPDTSALQPPSNICLQFFGFNILVLKEAFGTTYQVEHLHNRTGSQIDNGTFSL